MRPRRFTAIVSLLFLMAAWSFAGDAGKKPAPISENERRELLRNLMAERVFIHRMFPMGKVGLKIKDGQVTPSDQEVRQMAADFGPAVKPGDRAIISDVKIKKDSIVFEINGGPVKKKKWYERIQISGAGATTSTSGQPVDDTNLYTNARGSMVELQFHGYVPSITPDQVKQMLDPVFDFKAQSVAEAFERSLPPKLAEAVKNHHALVGMDREMVTYTKGRPPRRHRESENGTEYEEWIYGQPPDDVEFIRFVGDKVVRIETMRVDGEKLVRTQDEVGDLNGAISAMAKKEDQPKQDEDTSARQGPSLMRPGETTVTGQPGARNAPAQQLPQTGDPTGAPTNDPGMGAPQIPDASQGPPSMGGPPMGPPH